MAQDKVAMTHIPTKLGSINETVEFWKDGGGGGESCSTEISGIRLGKGKTLKSKPVTHTPTGSDPIPQFSDYTNYI